MPFLEDVLVDVCAHRCPNADVTARARAAQSRRVEAERARPRRFADDGGDDGGGVVVNATPPQVPEVEEEEGRAGGRDGGNGRDPEQQQRQPPPPPPPPSAPPPVPPTTLFRDAADGRRQRDGLARFARQVFVGNRGGGGGGIGVALPRGVSAVGGGGGSFGGGLRLPGLPVASGALLVPPR